MTNSSKESSDVVEKPDFIIEGNKFCCLFCGNKYLSRARCETHVQLCDDREESTACIEVNGTPKFQCNECSRYFKHLVGLKKHVKKHKPPGGFICSHCGKRYTSEAARAEHQKEDHNTGKLPKIVKVETFSESNDNPQEAYRCNDCGAMFRKEKIYQTHISTKCGTEKRFECDICSSKFLTKNTLYAHKQIHTGVKRHLCDYCGSSFLSKGQLKVHERSHTGEKPFKCEICNKGFSYRESLVTHSSIHTGIKPYACQACDLRYSCIGNLIKHRRARPDTCGLAKYQQNYKIAPRACTKIKHFVHDADAGDAEYNEEAEEQLSTSPVRETSPAIFESPPTIKKFSETNITDQKPILYRITEITSVDPQIIDLHNVDEIRSIKDENIIVTLKDDCQDENDDGDEDDDSGETKLNPSEEYLQYMQSDANSDDSDDEQDWYDKGEEIEFVENENGTDGTANYVLEIELQNTDEPEGPATNSVYTIIENANDEDCDTLIFQSNPEKDTSNEILIKYEKSDNDIEEDQGEENVSSPEKNGPPGLHKCTFCPKLYIQQDRLRTHLINDHAQSINESDSREELRTVENAGNSTDGESSLNVRTSLDVHRCPLCPKLYVQPIRLRNHLVIEHNANNDYSCKVCYKWFDSEGERKNHEANHGKDHSRILKCPTCELYFESLEELETHHNEIHFCYKCPKCSTVVDTMDALKSHTTEFHRPPAGAKSKNLNCESCNRMFSTKVALSDHQRSNCGQAPLYKCDICEKSYHSAGSLKTHKTMHSGLMPFVCKYCGKVFRTKGQVKVHERQHSGEKPYKCDACPKSFAYRESLLTHQSIHTGLKRFMCIPCGARFSCISNLQSHRKSHKLTCGQHPNFTKPIESATAEDSKMEVLVE